MYEGLDNQELSYRDKFLLPPDIIYFLGNSLGLQPKKTSKGIADTLNKWHKYGVEAFFLGDNPWMKIADSINISMSKLLGAKPEEVVVMNTLTTNLHLALVTFYRPEKNRYKILIEENAFPTDVYAFKSQLRYHGYDPEEGLVVVKSRDDKIHYEDIEEILEGGEIALTIFGGVNYYSGQVFDLDKITRMARKHGSVIGFDLAHAVGNIELDLHKIGFDFAVWCNYKYVNGGPGAPGGLFIHESHHSNSEIGSLSRFEGWWGNKLSTRFLMRDDFEAEVGAKAWQLSTSSPIMLSALRSSLDIFDEVGIRKLRDKSIKLTGYLQELIGHNFEIITPPNSGAQLSVRVPDKQLFSFLHRKGVYMDWREPDVIRLAPVPLYNTFEEVYKTSELMIKFL